MICDKYGLLKISEYRSHDHYIANISIVTNTRLLGHLQWCLRSELYKNWHDIGKMAEIDDSRLNFDPGKKDEIYHYS
jgi:hypothetical protein